MFTTTMGVGIHPTITGKPKEKSEAEKKVQIIKDILADGRVTSKELIFAKQNNVDTSSLAAFEDNVISYMKNNNAKFEKEFEKTVLALAKRENPDITDKEVQQLKQEWLDAEENNYRQKLLNSPLQNAGMALFNSFKFW